MADKIYTQKRAARYNGPINSSEYNARVEQNYQDLVYLYNRINILDSTLAASFERVLKDHIFLANIINDLSDRIEALEAAENRLSIHSFSQIDSNNFISVSEFAIPSAETLSFDPTYNIITLPKVSTGSFSKLKFSNTGVGQVLPEKFKAKIDNTYSGVDTPGATLDTTPIYNAILSAPNKVWKRNIISSTSNSSGAQMMVYFSVPSEISGTEKTNCIQINPFPAFGPEIFSIEYTTKKNPTLTQADGWKPLNENSLYDGDTDAVGKVPPGGWSVTGDDAIKTAGPIAYYFGEKNITAIRIKLNQKSYIKENNMYVYSYGLSDIDVRYDKFLPTGKTIIKFDAPDGETISEVTNVTPKIYNVPLSLISSAFSYRVIYGYPGAYQLNPTASNSVWIEITLNMLDDKTAPVLSDLVIDYV